jgi:hypothetical protein
MSAPDREKMTAMPPIAASVTEKREALEEVLQSAAFFRAGQLRAFLRYVCEMELAGRGDELCESLIGVEAFGRPEGYSPTEDASVRRRAGDLRVKLQEAYAGELAGSKIRIDLPKGKFVPRFVRVARENGVHEAPAELLPMEPSAVRQASNQPGAITASAPFSANLIASRVEALVYQRTRAWRRRLVTLWFAMGCLTGAAMVAAGLFTYRWLHPAANESPAAPMAVPQTATRVDTPPQPAAITLPAAESRGEQVGARPANREQSYEAEAPENAMHGITEAYPCSWCSGSGRVRNIGRFARNYLVMNDIVVARSGQYQMLLYYVLKGDRSFFIRVNEGSAVELPLSGKNWAQVSTASITLTLRAGSNSIRFYNDQHYAPDLDRVVIRQP